MAVKKVEFTQADEERLGRYRSQFIRLLEAQERDIYSLTDDLADEVQELIRKSDNDPAWVSKEAKSVMTSFALGVLKLMTKTNKRTAEIVLDEQMDYVGSLKNPDYLRMIKPQTNNFVTDITKSFVYRAWAGTGQTVGSRITTLTGSSLKSVQDVLQVSIDQGKSAKQTAELVKQYIQPTQAGSWVSPFQFFRDRFGFKVSPNRLSGSVSGNAIRIARTEINQTYRMGTLKFNQNQPWIIGFDWVLSPSHPAVDICDDWADDSPYDPDGAEIATLGHPYCLCTIQPITRPFRGDEYMNLGGVDVSNDYFDQAIDNYLDCLDANR